MRTGMRQPSPDAARKASLWGAFFVCALFALAPLAVLAESCRAPGTLREAREVKVVDGDTLRLADGRSLRLIGVNAPERARGGRPSEPFAEAATRQLERLVAADDGKVWLAVGAQARDHYGRSLAHAFGADGRSWAAQLLEAGLGFAVALAPNTALAGCLFAAERRARAAGLGIWRRSPQLAPGQLRQGGFALVRGRINGVEHNRGGLWLALDGALVVQVEPQWLAAFDVRRLQALAGREVEVRGWLVERRSVANRQSARTRWLLQLSHPAMLEAL